LSVPSQNARTDELDQRPDLIDMHNPSNRDVAWCFRIGQQVIDPRAQALDKLQIGQLPCISRQIPAQQRLNATGLDGRPRNKGEFRKTISKGSIPHIEVVKSAIEGD
jgi:hypothetical protein